MKAQDLLDQSSIERRLRKLPEANNIMWMGILSMIAIGSLLGTILAIVTITKANRKLNEYNKHPAIYTEKSVKRVRAGRICAIIGVGIRIVLIIILVNLKD